MCLQNYQEILDWYEYGNFTKYIEDNFCSNRAEFNGRLVSYETLLKKKFQEECLYLANSSFGEIGNNCFDHNLGFWQDRAGCLFVRDVDYCLIADRGRGIKASLSSAYQLSATEPTYISVAFQKVISGRAPEKRGNGLKYTKKNVLKCQLNLFCNSDCEKIFIGDSQKESMNPFAQQDFKNSGTLTFIYW